MFFQFEKFQKNTKRIKIRKFIIPSRNSYNLLSKFFKTDLFEFELIEIGEVKAKYDKRILATHRHWTESDLLDWPGWSHIKS